MYYVSEEGSSDVLKEYWARHSTSCLLEEYCPMSCKMQWMYAFGGMTPTSSPLQAVVFPLLASEGTGKVHAQAWPQTCQPYSDFQAPGTTT